MSLTPPLTVGKLQAVLHAKAKDAPTYRFYSLYDKMYRGDVLDFAWQRCRANGGAAGVDGQTFQHIEAYGVEKWLGELTQELRNRTYRPQAVKRVWIPKADGNQRPLGIPAIRDRVVQMAAVLVLEPIFEADLLPEQHAYRPEKSALQAVRAVQKLLDDGYTEVVDADLSGYFDSIPHTELMKSVSRRVSDRHLLHLIKMWMEVAVEERDDHGNCQRTTRNRDEGRGIPQGGVVSPLLANLYMRRFLLGWKAKGYETSLKAYIVNYADDFVICTRNHAAEAMEAMRAMMQKLKLTVNEKKTRNCQLPSETFTFLGYTFGQCYSRRTGRDYLSPYPSDGKVQSLCKKISEMTDRRTVGTATQKKVEQLNAMLRGWGNYFCLGPVVRIYEVISKHVRRRLRRWLCRKHKVRTKGYGRYPNEYIHTCLGVVDLTQSSKRGYLWAKA